ncbi:MAG: carboxypeptidase-like regulatory domain-containing protein [Cyclobacteriaceae bacterium]
MRHLLWLLILLAVGQTTAQTLSIAGRVIDDQSNEALIGAHVLPMRDWSNGTTTNVNGAFSLDLLQSDSLLISYIGYEEQLFYADDDLEELMIRLVPKATQVAEVQVVADRIISEDFIVKKIDRLEVYKNPNAKGDALLAVNALPSATTLDESANVSFRGSTPGETGIFYNHVPIYDGVRFAQLNGIGTFSIFNTEMIGSIHVFPGNPPLEYGNTSSGLIAIQSSDNVPSFKQTQLNLSLANLGVFHRGSLGKKKKTGLTIFGNYQPSQLIKATNDAALEDISWFQSADFGWQLTHRLNETSRLRVFNYSLLEGYDFNYKSPSYSGLFVQRKRRNFTIANYLKQLEKGVLSVNGGFSLSDQTLDISASAYDIGLNDKYLSLNYHRASKRVEWKVGMAYDGRSQSFNGNVPLHDFALAEHHPRLSIDQKQSRDLLDAFGYFKYRPSKMISFGYAVRANAPIDGQRTRLARQRTINFAPSETHQFIYSGGTYHRYAFSDEGAPSWIKSKQQSIDYQLTLGAFSGTISAYLKSVTSGELNTEIAGIETYWKYKIAKRLFADISYSFINMTEEQNNIKSPGMYDLNYFMRAGFEWQFLTYWTLGGRLLHRQGAYYQRVSSSVFESDLGAYRPIYSSRTDQERLPYYQIIDWNISRIFSLSNNLSGVAFLSMSNVLNRENIRNFTYNQDYSSRISQLFSQRTVYFGVSIYIQ